MSIGIFQVELALRVVIHVVYCEASWICWPFSRHDQIFKNGWNSMHQVLNAFKVDRFPFEAASGDDLRINLDDRLESFSACGVGSNTDVMPCFMFAGASSAQCLKNLYRLG